MKKALFIVLILLMVGGMAFAQEWGGLVRFNLGNNIIELIYGSRYFQGTIDIVPYIKENLGIPIDITLRGGPGGGFIQLLSGIEGAALSSREKNGLFFTALAGPLVVITDDVYLSFAFKGDVGYQLVTNGGFVFTPAIGFRLLNFVYIEFDLKLDIGFAWRKR